MKYWNATAAVVNNRSCGLGWTSLDSVLAERTGLEPGLKAPSFKIGHGIEVAVAAEDRQPML